MDRQEVEDAKALAYDEGYQIGAACRQTMADEEIDRLRSAIRDFLAECALEFGDERLGYERWQITVGALDELRKAVS